MKSKTRAAKYWVRLIFSQCLLLSLTFTLRAQAEETPSKAAKVVTQIVKKETVRDTAVLAGVVEAARQVAIVAESDGEVSSCKVELGKYFKAGQTLCTLQNSDPAYTFRPVAISAPLSGVVSEIFAADGARVHKGEKLFNIIDPKAARFVVEAPAELAISVPIGQRAHWENLDHKPMGQLVLKAKAPFVDPTTRTVRLEFTPVKGMLPFAQVGRLVLSKGERNVLKVPEASVTYEGKNPKVKSVKNGKVELLSVQLGNSDGDNVEIVKGVPDGTAVILRTSSYVHDGSPVQEENSSKEQKL